MRTEVERFGCSTTLACNCYLCPSCFHLCIGPDQILMSMSGQLILMNLLGFKNQLFFVKPCFDRFTNSLPNGIMWHYAMTGHT